MKKKHGAQKRKQGTPYYLHPLAVCQLLREKGFPIEYQIVGLFHDLLEDTDATDEEIEEYSNREILEAVKLLTKKPGYVMDEYMENIRNSDLAKMVKLADRIHNLSEAKFGSESFQRKYVDETERWFIDLAKGTVFDEDLNILLNDVRKSLVSDNER